MQPWQEWSRRLKEVLGLDSGPVAVTYTDVPATNGRAKRVMAGAAFHIDPGSRHLVKGFKPGELIFSVPYFYMPSIIDAIDRSTAGTAAPGMTFGELLSGVKGR